MKTVKLNDCTLGYHIGDVIEKAKDKAKQMNQVVEFDFNEIQCLVSRDTSPDLLLRDYGYAHLMQWETIGPICQLEYPKSVKEEIEKREHARNQRQEEQRKEAERKDTEERTRFEEKTKGVVIQLLDVDGWNDWKATNTDPYGACIFEYAESWAKLMQVEISKGNTLQSIAEQTSFELGFLGITGFMYGAAVSILSKCWVHGEQLRIWHNKEYGHKGDGVVNPAILTVGK